MIAVQRWRMIITYLCSGFIILAVGCKDTRQLDDGQDKRPMPVQRYGGTYHKPLRQEPLTLDPAFLTDVVATSIAQQLFDGLVQFDADLNVVPSIAKAWEASHDGLVVPRGTESAHDRASPGSSSSKQTRPSPPRASRTARAVRRSARGLGSATWAGGTAIAWLRLAGWTMPA